MNIEEALQILEEAGFIVQYKDTQFHDNERLIIHGSRCKSDGGGIKVFHDCFYITYVNDSYKGILPIGQIGAEKWGDLETVVKWILNSPTASRALRKYCHDTTE